MSNNQFHFSSKRRYLFVFFLLCFLAGYFTVSIVSKAETESSQRTVAVELFTVDQDQTVLLSVHSIQRYVVTDPRIVQVLEKTEEGLLIKGTTIGNTIILLWDNAGLRTLRVVVRVPAAQIKLHEEIRQRSSKLYRSHKDRAFRFFHQSTFSVLNTGAVLGRLDEASKTNDHDFRFEGQTPYGILAGQTLYEYRKDKMLEKSVSMTRDLKAGLYDSKMAAVQGYDFVGGQDFVWKNQYGLPGVRMEGVQIRPSQRRIIAPKSGQVDFGFLAGQERDGGLIDSPAGIRNRKLKDKMAAQEMAVHLGTGATLSGGLFQRWGGPKEQQSDHNFVGQYRWENRNFFARSEIGGDGETQSALDIEGGAHNLWFDIHQGWRNVDKDYLTISGSPPGRGYLGYYGGGRVLPFALPLKYEKFEILWGTEVYRDRLSINPEKPKKYIKNFYPGTHWQLPGDIYWDTFFILEDFKAASFPYLHREFVNRVSRDFWLAGPWIKSVGFYIQNAIDSYRKASDTPGFNSDRYEIAPGIHMNLPFGFYGSGEYHWNRLEEKDPVDPGNRTYPAQMMVELGWNHQLGSLPLMLDFSGRYVDERNTFGKIHQPFAGQDRLEFRAGVQYQVRSIGVLFAESRALMARSIEVPDLRNAEFTLDAGVRVRWDSPFYIPARGKIQGFVFNDKNGNGVKDPSEPGIAGYRVKAEPGSETSTDGSGHYKLEIWESEVVVKMTSPLLKGYFFTTQSQQSFEILPESDETLNFGIATQISVKGRIFLDLDGDKIYSSGDVPMSGVQVQLQSGQSGISGVDGWYSIIRVPPGSNRLMLAYMTLPQGYHSQTGIRYDFEGQGGDSLEYNFPMAADRIISGFVFEDTNRDGVMGKDEKGIPGVVVKTVNGQVTTNQQGTYILRDLPYGEVTISLDPAGIPKPFKAPKPAKTYTLSKEPVILNQENFPLQK